ncbi:uncharacterized protein LOC133526929 [Cydia pomonella]|uniref:uncharacterized protein LOC133519729 n=1 Tax=Cydia pomonella TaxID=82600 RepID=UPI002ADDD554|nr:uncharacterized protein LOC133519700 isoform X2 [Cydia pomonella]XP_061709772.1 uncharacterized protein LOC133519729 [Cydia pomonella]XP_061719773.1 uncharacterized protein LOC133526929 [Cydia pomonella]
MAGKGKFSEFDVKTGNWTLYCDRLDMYFLANGVTDDLKLATLIANVGESAYELIVNLCSPDKPSTLTYAKVVSLVKEHLEPVPSALAERYKFRQCRQQNGQSIAEYVATLKQMARFCDFGSGLEENLRDQLVCGITSDAIRQRLFADKKLEYSKAVLIATTMESAEKDSSAVESPVIGMHYNASQIGKKQCTACGDTRHERFACKFKDYICDTCSRVGHLRRVCPEKEGHRARARPGATKSWGTSQEHGSGSGSHGYNERALTGRGGSTAGRRRRGARTGAALARHHCIRGHPDPAEEASWRDNGGEGSGAGLSRRTDSDDEWPIYQMGLSQYPPV